MNVITLRSLKILEGPKEIQRGEDERVIED